MAQIIDLGITLPSFEEAQIKADNIKLLERLLYKECLKKKVSKKDMISSKRSSDIVKLRVDFVKRVKKEHPKIPVMDIAEVLNRDHSTILHYLNYYIEK